MFYFKNNDGITVYFANGNVALWKKDNSQYEKVVQLAKDNQWVEIQILYESLKALLNGNVCIKDDTIHLSNKHGSAEITMADSTDPVIKFIYLLKKKGTVDKHIKAIKPFLTKMFENKYIDAVEEIYDFCTHMDFELTTDGNFIAYKHVNYDLSSIHDNGQTKHQIGEYTEVDKFCTDRNIACAEGLHFCSRNYLNSYSGSVTIAVEIDPRDVVSIPVDHNFEKGRCCRYKTLCILPDGVSLKDVDINKLTNGAVTIVDSSNEQEEHTEEPSASSDNNKLFFNRIEETVYHMSMHNNVEKVAELMGISTETVKRNLRKAKERKMIEGYGA